MRTPSGSGAIRFPAPGARAGQAGFPLSLEVNEFEKMKKNLVYVRITAILLSSMVASLTFLNVVTVATHAIEFEIPEEGDFQWAVDPVGQRLIFITNFTVRNQGAFDITKLNIAATVETSNHSRLIDFEEKNLAVIHGEDKTFTVLVSLSADALEPSEWFGLLVSNDELSLTLDIDADYMFGLVHVTVDEVIEYPWQAPLSKAAMENAAVSAFGTLLDMAEKGLVTAMDYVEPAVLELLASLNELRLDIPGGGEFLLDAFAIDNGTWELACHLSGPLGDGSASFSIRVLAGISDAGMWADIKGVSFEYVG